MKYIFLAFKTFIAVVIVFGVACSIYAISGTKAYLDRMSEEARIRDEHKEESFNRLCDFAENNLDELLEFSDMYISMLSPENPHIKIEAEGDMQEFRDKLFDNIGSGYATIINSYDEKCVIYNVGGGPFTGVIEVYEEDNPLSAVISRVYNKLEKDVTFRVFVYIDDNPNTHHI